MKGREGWKEEEDRGREGDGRKGKWEVGKMEERGK